MKSRAAVVLWFAVIMALLSGMVGGCGSLDAQYVAADKENFTATKFHHEKYKRLSPADAVSIDRLDRRRLDRIDAAERNLAGSTVPKPSPIPPPVTVESP